MASPRHSLIKLRWLVLWIWIGATTSCSTNDGIREYNAYEGETLAATEVALLHVPVEIKVDRIDGQGRYYPLLEVLGNPYRGAVIQLLPGSHTADVIFHSRYWYTSDIETVTFHVEAGRHYEVRADITEVDYVKHAAFEVVSRQSQ